MDNSSWHQSVTILTPVYNEAETIETICDRIERALGPCRVVIVDDGSTDLTARILGKWHAREGFIVLRHEQNQGKGAAIRTALERVDSRFVVIQDADLEYDPSDQRAVLQPLLSGASDVVYGTRYSRFPSSLCRTWDPGAVVGWLAVLSLNFTVRILYGYRTSDEATCLKAFRTSDLKRMALQCRGFEFCSEVTAKAARLGLRYSEVPVSYLRRTRRQGKRIRARDGFIALWTLVRYRNWSPGASDPPAISSPGSRLGFTIVELLTVVSVIALLIAILLPAVQQTRESARRTQCASQLRELSLGCLGHESAQSYLPTGGWGWRWVGDPDQGYSRRQPGGWTFNILPFIEQSDLRRFGTGLPSRDRADAMGRLVTTPLPLLNCPARREPMLYPYTALPIVNASHHARVAKADYACSGGTLQVETGTGPSNLSPKAIKNYKWPDTRTLNGVIFAFSEVPLAKITDGTGKTYLLGEKHIPFDQVAAGTDPGDDQTMYLGDDADVRRWSFTAPLPDNDRKQARDAFGSPHRDGCLFALCDGSVETVGFDVAPSVHRSMGNRSRS